MDEPDATPGGEASAEMEGFGTFDAHVLRTGLGIIGGCAVVGLLIGAAGSGEAGAVALIGAGLGAVIAVAVLGVSVVRSM